MSTNHNDTIAAQATPSGRGGIGIIRISGPKVLTIAQAMIGKIPEPRYTHFCSFLDDNGEIIDQGIALYFPAPNSFTGEDVLELHGHGGPIILDCVLRRILQLGVRMARPGEFSERAFLNDKMDLAQAEAVADLIDATSEQAARNAIRSLQGEFSQYIRNLVEALIHLRMHVEATIDFPEEEIDFLSDGKIATDLAKILTALDQVRASAQQGALLRDGMTVVIAGKPNAGKSSLLNALSGKDVAIVTEIPGTTRDILREQILINGLPLHIVDTAGLRQSKNKIEQEGIRRAHQAIKNADIILLVIDANCDKEVPSLNEIRKQYIPDLSASIPLIVIKNKIDLISEVAKIQKLSDYTLVSISAKTGAGISLLQQQLTEMMGYNANIETNFSARRRHLEALAIARKHLVTGQQQLEIYRAGELLAEELRQAQQALSEITGEFRSDDLLGQIFSSFCVGK